ncbi:MAG: radical SAM protein [Candidatus Omnitrophota bacterium]|nr:radical SAM protein [Candidatus Omnitrophota bacterium]
MRKADEDMSSCENRDNMTAGSPDVLKTLYINPTKFCNLRCRHCWVSPPQKDVLDEGSDEISAEQLEKVISEAKKLGLTAIKLTGGEPLLRKDIGEIFRFCADLDVKVSVETNGTLITEKTAGLFRKYGVFFVSVSLDSHSEDLNDFFRGRKGAYKAALRGIRFLLEEGIPVQVIISLYRENLRDFRLFLGLMREIGVNNVKINTISILGRGANLMRQGILPGVEEILDFYKKMDLLRETFNGFLYLDIPIVFKSLEDIKNGLCGSCNIKNILGIISDGSVSVCGIGYLEKDLLFGNVKDDPRAITRIWHENETLKRIKEDIPSKLEGVCGICVFRHRCLGYCRAEVYYNTRDLLAPYWFCQEAYEKGLFPSTRLIPEPLRT